MAFLSSTDDALTALVHQEPLRFTGTLPLISTRFTPPRTPESLLSRERLLLRLDAAVSRRLTLVRAPAGFGKTTLLAQWYRHRLRQGDALAWLSLEEDDNAPLLFIRYLQEALRPLWQGWSPSFLQLLQGELPADLSLFFAELVNQLNQCPHPLYLILDDYQCISDPAIHQGMSWLLHHAPPALHLIIGSRSQPPLALSRLHMQDQLLEVYDPELRFSPSEARAWFAGASGLDPQAIPRLIALTEGWIAGMKMAALSADASAAMGLSAGSRSITRYLDEVIFAPLPPEVFDFLLQTSMLNRLHPDLCDVVCGRNNARAMLAWIERHNLFLSALDESGLWFRYHPLMRDALLHRLRHSGEIDIRQLHDRASGWFASQQLWAEAIRHALAAGKSAAKDAEAGAQSLAEEGDIDTLVQWIRYLPANPDPSRIALQLNLAWALAHRFRFSEARQLLDAIEMQSAAHGEALAHSAWVKLRVVRAICEAFADNIDRSIAIVEPLLREVPCGDIWVDGLVCNILSYCHLADSRPQQALEVQQRVSDVSLANRNLFVTVYRAFVMAQSYLRQGNLAEAERQAARALRYAERHAGENASSGATLAPILAEIAWEQGKGERKAYWFRVWRPSTAFVRPMALAAATSFWPARPGKRGGWRRPNHYYCMPKDWRPNAAGCGRRRRCWRSGSPSRFTRATNRPLRRCCFVCRASARRNPSADISPSARAASLLPPANRWPPRGCWIRWPACGKAAASGCSPCVCGSGRRWPSGVPASGSWRWLSADRRLRARCIRGYGAACWRGGKRWLRCWLKYTSAARRMMR